MRFRNRFRRPRFTRYTSGASRLPLRRSFKGSNKKKHNIFTYVIIAAIGFAAYHWRTKLSEMVKNIFHKPTGTTQQ